MTSDKPLMDRACFDLAVTHDSKDYQVYLDESEAQFFVDGDGGEPSVRLPRTVFLAIVEAIAGAFEDEMVKTSANEATDIWEEVGDALAMPISAALTWPRWGDPRLDREKYAVASDAIEPEFPCSSSMTWAPNGFDDDFPRGGTAPDA